MVAVYKYMTLTDSVMKKVKIIFLVRRIATPFVFFIGSVVIIFSTVSVSNVISNMPASDILAVTKFFAAAFAHTDVIVKSALVAGLVLSVLMLKGLIESLKLLSYPHKA